MECGRCRHDNEGHAKFCSECGAPLAARCSACDAQQPPGSKFCNQCGTPMSAGAATPAAAVATSAPPTAVRKQVTALFADLVGSTAFGERVDPEAARAALTPYFEILQSTIEGHAGTVAKFTGDGVMAIFGIPEVAEDDALRAVAAGLELQGRFRAFAESVRDRHGVELGLRVGINTGELVIDADDADLVGDVLNTAARLEAACEPGRVMVGEDTWRLSRSVVPYEVLGEVRVKGKAEALATFLVVDHEQGAADDTTPFVGRRDELDVLRSVFDDAVDSAAARLVTVIGAPGVGKTRLAAELRGEVEPRSFDLRFERRGSSTFTPIVDLLRELTQSGSADDVALLVADHAEASRLAPVLASLLGHGEARTTEESFWAVRRLLEHLAAHDPLVIVVDDIQWAEPLFWDLLDHLVEWTEAPVLLVALARPELRELRPELTQAGRRVSASVALEGLDADTTRELAARLLDTDELPPELIERIPDSTEGNPLFVRELVQMLVDDGVLARAGDRWRLTIDADAIEVPPTVLSLLASRVERLPDDERHVVELASVIGTEFDRGLLGAIAGPDVSARLGATIDRLRRKDLVEPSGAWAGDHPVYRFHHVLVRDAAYRRLLKGHRAELHQRVGEYVDQVGTTDDDADVVVAFHYEQVHRYRSELGTVDDATLRLAGDAAARLHTAAAQALERDDPTAAGGFAERALTLSSDVAQRGELLLLGCEALFASGNVSRGAALVDAMGDHVDRDERFDAWSDCFRAQLWSLTDPERLEEAERVADAAAGRLDALEDLAGVAKARLVRAACLARLGRVGDCEDELDLALGAARAAGDRRRTVAVLGAAPLAALWGPSPVARAGGRCLDVLRLLRITSASPAVEATSVRCQGMLEALRGRLDSARSKLEQSRATAREIGLRQGLFETELFAGLVELLDGDPAAAESHLRAAHDGLGRLGIGADAGQAAALLARALLRQGHVDDADTLAGEALASAGQNLQTAMAARAVLAEVRSAQGRHDEAVSLIAEATEIAERTDVIVDHALVALAATDVADAIGDANAARRHRERAHRLLDAKGVTLDLTIGIDAPDPAEAAETSERPVHAPTAENEATRIGERVADALLAGDRESFAAAYRDDAVFTLHLSLQDSVFAHDTLDLRGWAEACFSLDEETPTLSAIAVRGEHLCLSRLDLSSADRHRTVLTINVVDDGKVARTELFGSDQLWDAIDRLDELWLGPDMTVGARTGNYRAVASGDSVAIRRFLADDFESIDSRRLGHEVRDREQYVESQLPRGHEPWVAVPVEVLRHEAFGDWVIELDRLSVSAGDSVVEMFKVFAARGRRIVRSDDFDLDDVGAAHRRVDELVAERTARPTGALENEATAVARLGLGLRADRDVIRPHYSPELRWHERRAAQLALGYPAVLDREAVLEARVAPRPGEGVSSYDLEVVAIRGAHLGLVRLSLVTEAGFEREALVIYEVRDGVVQQVWFFDEHDLRRAQQELDEIWFDSIGLPEGAATRRRNARVYAVDPNELALDVHADLVFRDHRQISFVSGDVGAFLQNAPAMDLVDHIVVPRIHRIEPRRLVAERCEVGADGMTATMLIVGGFADGLVHSIDLYEPFDLDTALARYDELDPITAPSPEEQPTARSNEVRNTASDAIGETSFLRTRADLGTIRDRIHPDFVGRHRGHVFSAAGEMDRDEWIELIDSVLEVGGRYESDVVAVRGDDLALSRVDFVVGDDVSERLVLTRLDDGLVRESVVFEGDDLQDALDEFDRQDTDLHGQSGVGRLLRRARRANFDGDRDAVRDLLAPDFHIDDRRTLGIGDVSRDDYVRTSTRAGTTYLTREILDDSGSAALARSRWVAHDGSAWDQLDVLTYGDDQLRSVVLFDPDDLASARALFDELAESEPSERTNTLANEASALADRMHDLMTARDLDGLDAIVHPEFVGHSARRFRTMDSFTFDQFRQQWFAVYDTEGTPTNSTSTVLAVRGDTLALGEIAGEFGDAHNGSLALARTADGCLAELWFYDDDDLKLALDELDRQFEATLDPVPLSQQVSRRMRAAIEADDRSAYRALLSDDCVGIDHRRIGLGFRSADELADSLPEDDVVMVARDLIAMDDRHVLALAEVRAEKSESVIAMLILNSVDAGSGLVSSTENFDQSDLEAALARFRELAGTAASDGVAGEVGSERRFGAIPNAAFRISRLADECLARGDRAGLDALIHPDGVGHSHRSSRLWDDVDGERFVDSWFDLFDTAGTPTGVDATLLATSGEHLCFEESVIALGDDVITALVLTRIDGNQIAEVWIYDSTDLRSALDEFNCHAGELEQASAPVIQLRRMGSAIDHGDRAHYRSLLRDDLVSVDHRALGLGTRTVDDLVESAYREGMRSRSRHLVAVDDDNLLIHLDMSVGGDDSEIGLYTLLAVDAATCLITTLEFFDESDRDAALSRFGELAAPEHADGEAPPFTNEAAEVARRAHGLFADVMWGDGDRHALLTLVDPGYRGHDEKAFRVADDFDADDFLTMWTAGVETARSPTRHEFEPLAIRGATFCLGRLSFEFGDDHLHRLFITRVEDGLIAEHWWFEPDALHDALDRLNELWGAGRLTPIDLEIESRYRRAFATGTADDFRAIVTDDYEFRDHRQLGMGVRDLDEYLATSGDFFGHIEIYSADVIEWEPPALLSLGHARLEGADQVADYGSLMVTVGRDDRIAVQECFDIDDLAAARARFAELLTEYGSPAVDRVANRATELFAEAHRRFVGGDREHWRRMFAEHFEASSRERLAPDATAIGRDDYVDLVHELRGAGPTEASYDVLAVRGDHVCLVRMNLTFDGDDQSKLFVVETTTDLIARYVVFDPDQLDDALDELGRRWIDLGGVAEIAELEARFRRAFSNADAVQFRAGLHDDFVSLDHRALGLGQRSADEYAASNVFADGGAHFLFPRQIVEIDGHGRVWLARWTRGESASEAQSDFWAITVNADRLLRRVETFDIADLDPARARFDELVRRVHDDVDELDVASARFDGQGGAIRFEDWDAVAVVPHAEFGEQRRRLVRPTSSDVPPATGAPGPVEIVSGPTSVGYQLLAVRGDDLVLGRYAMEADGRQSQRWAVQRVDGERPVTTQWFADDELDDAFDELDRQWVASGGPSERVEHLTAMRRALASGDQARIRSCLSDDFLALDERPIGFAPRDADEWAAASADWPVDPATGRGGIHAAFLYYLDQTDTTSLGHLKMTTEGGELELWSVDQVRDGLVVRHDMFDLGDVDAARARYEQMLAEEHDAEAAAPADPTSPAPHDDTVCVRLLEEFASAWSAGDLDRARALVSDDVVIESYRTVVTPGHTRGEAAIEALFSFHEFMPRWSQRVLDTRADDLVLADVRLHDDGGMEVRMLAVFQMGADGRSRRAATFDADDLARARAVLDDWHAGD